MYTEPICLNDAQIYKLDLFPQIAERLQEYPDICVIYQKTFKFKFTGILLINDIPVVVFPKNYKLPNDLKDVIGHASILVRVFLRYRNEPFHDSSENELLYGDSNNCNARITTALTIMEDYKMYGLLKRKYTVTSTTKNGRVDWAFTINKIIPTINHNHVIYDMPIVKYSKYDKDNIVFLIHKYVVSQCIEIWGWLYGFNSYDLDKQEQLPCLVSEAITILKTELTNVYIQREINTIKMLISYLTAQSGQEKLFNKEILGTQYFSFVWEAVCGYLFDNKYPLLHSLIPQPEWESEITLGKISQRPDIFAVDNNTLYILDAKYYNFKSNLPGWHDVVKQLFYRHTVILNLAKAKIPRILQANTVVNNAFLFPGEETNLLQYIGRVFVKEIDDLGEVKAFAIDQHMALKTYAYRNDDLYRKHLLEKLSIMYSIDN